MIVTASNLEAAVGCPEAVAARWAPHLAESCSLYRIDTRPNLAAYLAQIGHESAGLTKVTENLNYGAPGLMQTWPGRFDSARARQCARQPQRIANWAYANRLGNGPPESGDGWKYRGRGLIQVTGRSNYEATTELLRERFADVPDFPEAPDLLTEPQWAARSAAAFWFDHDLNELAEQGLFDRITQRINGGQNGAADRRARHERALRALA